MSEVCLSNNTCSKFLSLLLYLSYFIFFAPYILKLLSFLSPLFITISLLLLALLIHENFKSFPQNESSLYHAVLEMLKSKADHGKNDEFCFLEDFEVYEFVFEKNQIEFLEYTSTEVSEKIILEKSVQEKGSNSFTNDLENPDEMEMTLEEFLKETDEFESKTRSNNVESKKIEALGTKGDKVVEKQKEEMIVRNGSKEATVDKVKKAHSWRLYEDNLDYNNSNDNLGSYGSLRKEKEWKRTLACKLYEERYNAAASDDITGEGMDLLWETYELDSAKSKVKRDYNNIKKKNKIKKKGELKGYKKEQEEEEMNEPLCCLQVLNFSAGKMNLGMGRPNLVKISKAIRGFGWLHHVTKKNKVHCGDRF